MRFLRVTLLLTLAVALAPARRACAQSDHASPGREAGPMRIGLALSGGSAKGIAHVGVLRALERAGVRIDVVAGTSMGSVVGGLYALGLPVDSIEAIIASADWPSLMGDGVPRGRRFLEQRRLDERSVLVVPLEEGRAALPTGAIRGSNVIRLLEAVTWPGAAIRSFEDLPRPFVAVATDLETGEAVPLTGGVLAEALRASTGIPGVVVPIDVDGRLLVDGAVSRNLPAQDARALGADYLICSDVADPIESRADLETLVDVLAQVIVLTNMDEAEEQRARCDIVIRPDVLGLSAFAFDDVPAWVARGEKATEPFQEALTALVASTGSRSDASAAPSGLLEDSVRLTRIEVTGTTDRRLEAIVRRQLRLVEDRYVDRDGLRFLLEDLDATGLFGLVRYRLDVAGATRDATLTVNVEEGARDRLGLGVRYDDERRAALLFTTTLHNRLFYGSVTRLDIRVGEETRLGGSIFSRRGVTGTTGGGVSAFWNEGRLRPAGGGWVDVHRWTLSAFAGVTLGRGTFVGVEGLADRLDVESGVGLSGETVLSGGGVIDHETLDRIDFPRSGADVLGRFEAGVSGGSLSSHFTKGTFDARYYLPLHDRLTVDAGAFLGYATGIGLPVHRRFYLGGAHASSVFSDIRPLFQGMPRQGQSGRAVQIGRLGLRWESWRGVYLRAGVDVGAVREDWRFPLERPMTGWAFSAGLDTLVGPVQVEWAKVWDGPEGRLSVNVGRTF